MVRRHVWRVCSKAPFTWYNLLSNRLSNRFDNRVNVYAQYNRLSNRLYNLVWQPVEQTAVCSTRLSNRLSNLFDNRFDNRLYRVYKHWTGCQTVFVKPVVQPGLTTGWTNSCSFNTVVKPVWQPVWQALDVCLHDTAGCQTGLTTGCKPVVSCKRGLSITLLYIWCRMLQCAKKLINSQLTGNLRHWTKTEKMRKETKEKKALIFV